MKKILMVFVIGLSMAVSSYAEFLKSEEDIKNLADNFMTEVGKGEYKKAFDGLKSHWPLPEDELNNLAYQTESQLNMVADRFGKLLGSEYIRANRIGTSYIRYIYIQKFNNHATRWMIIFYRPSNEWKVNSVIWDDKTSQLFDLNVE